MTEKPATFSVDHEAAAEVLRNIAAMMATFHSRDVALQDALSNMTRMSGETGAMHELQHIDMLTQTHEDLAKLLPVLADCVRGTPTHLNQLKAALTLRSLQDKLLDTNSDEAPPDTGELSLF